MKRSILEQLKQLAQNHDEVVVLWLYGSRAKGFAHAFSDYDLAVAFGTFIKNDTIAKRLRPECLALDWQQALALPENALSIVDINQAPIPLAFEIVDADEVLFCRDENRLWREILPIHNRMELDYA